MNEVDILGLFFVCFFLEIISVMNPTNKKKYGRAQESVPASRTTFCVISETGEANSSLAMFDH